MYIKEIHINSFRHLKDIHLGPFAQPPDLSDLVVLAGPNAGGKSSVLELLGYALSNSWSIHWSLRRSFPSYSFEVAIAVTPDERHLVQEYLISSQTRYEDSVLKHFNENGTYYRAFNYAEGKYQKNAPLYDPIHNLITNALRNHYRRSLGFFLKSDRYYPPEGFRRDRLFEYEQITKLDYIWNMAFNTSDVQYKDMFEFLVQQRYHYFRRLGAYHHRLRTTGEIGGDAPSDPLQPYDELLNKLFPGYRFTDIGEQAPSNLFVHLPSGQVVQFTDLSSGEKEVFFILSFFLRHDVTNAVIAIDEPELHLHPELARLLIRTMQSIRPGNQLWLATHNPEIIDEAGRDRVIYLARDSNTNQCVVTLGTDETKAMRQLKDLFGYSGYIGIAKRVVFLEGIDSSSDRKMFSSLFPEYGSKLKFVPCKSSENLARINAAILSILESNLGWMDFYLIRDRDFLTPESIQKYRKHSSGRMYVLNRYHIENYLLDEGLIAKVQTEIFGKPATGPYVREKLKTISQSISAEMLRDMVKFRLNLLYRPEDFSLGKFMERQAIIFANGSLDLEKKDQFTTQLVAKISDVNKNLLARTQPDQIDALISQCQEEIRQAIVSSSDDWKSLFPGRRLLEEYAISEGLGKPPVFQNSLIKELSASPGEVEPELRQVIQIIIDGGPFA